MDRYGNEARVIVPATAFQSERVRRDAGMPRAEAVRRARAEFGNLTRSA